MPNEIEPPPTATAQITTATEPPAFKLTIEERIGCLKKISRQLLQALIGLFAVIAIIVIVLMVKNITGNAAAATVAPRMGGLTPLMVFLIGILGGYVSLQRRLKTFSDFDLHLLANSWLYTLLAPFVGGLLATLLLYVFIGGMLQGPLFPEFIPAPSGNVSSGDFISVFFVGADPESYARLIFWSFVAGFSERFVVDMVGQFEKKAAGE